MGFCEMVYHETRSFPESEREGLAKELRASSLNLLRQITIESVKPQKEFLKSLDNTVETQLQVLLLLKLAFRMEYINQRVYQTMEEDLKGLENIINEMKGLHGITVSSESIYASMQNQQDPEVKEKGKPDESSVAQKSHKKPKEHESYRSSGKKHHRSRTGKSSRTHSSKSKGKYDKTSGKTDSKQPEKQPDDKSDEAQKSSGNNFEGTPLYDDENNKKTSSGTDDKEDTRKNPFGEKEKQEDSGAQKTRKGRFSLKSSFSRKPFRKPQSKKKE